MHAAARAFVERWVRPDTDDPVIEIGSRNVNGGLRDLFPRAPEHQTYVGIDIADGPGVDIVCDAADYVPPELVDLVLCCEVLEHAERWQAVLLAAASWLRPGGRLIVTCAGPGRPPHSAVDGGELRQGEYYWNLTTWELVDALAGAGIRIEACEYDGQHCDCRISGVRRG